MRQPVQPGAHTHRYNYTECSGRDCITTAMTGARSVPRLGAIDHVVWITMAKEGLKIANLILKGIVDKLGPTEEMIDYGLYRPRSR